jgi:DNA-directed RNA polymerase subunit F
MSTFEIIEERPIDLTELKSELESIKKRDKELGFRSNRTKEYLEQIGVEGDNKALIKKIVDLGVPRLKDLHIVKIVDNKPETVEDLKMVLQGYPLTVNADNLKKIVEAIK